MSTITSGYTPGDIPDSVYYNTFENNITISSPTKFVFDAEFIGKVVKFDCDVEIGRDYSSKTLTVKSQTNFINYVSFNTASGNFILQPGSIIPDEVLRYTTLIKDLENLANALRKDYFYKHFYEWIEAKQIKNIEN